MSMRASLALINNLSHNKGVLGERQHTGFQKIQPVMYVACAETGARLTFLPPSTGWRCNASKDGYRSFLAV